MNHILARIPGSARILVLTVGVLIVSAPTSHAQYGGMGYGGMGYGGYGGMGYGGMGYGGYGGYGGGYGGYGGGYGGYGGGYGGYGGGYGGYGGGYGYGAVYANPAYSYGYPFMPGYVGTGLTGLGPTGIGWQNPYFSAGLSPLAVNNVFLERSILGRTSARSQVSRSYVIQPRASTSARVGTGTFSSK